LCERGGHVLPGVAELLAILGERDDLHVGLLTGNTAGGARLKLAHFDLHERFAFGGYGDVHFNRNAVAADAHAELRRHSGREIPAERIWVIGDTPHDVACARHIGASVIAVATGQHAREELEAARPDVLLDDLRNVERVMEIVAPAIT
jgi:phosphoglycolate phosphatase-like HAD superfamily hydrolase